MDKTIWFDIESSSLPVHKARIITISFLYQGKEKTLCINPMVPIDPNASRVNGIYDQDVVDWKPFSHYAKYIYELCLQCDAYGGFNNQSFDVPLLAFELLRCGYVLPDKPVIDVYILVQGLFKSLKLKDIYRTLTQKELDAHKSIEDIRATFEIYTTINEKYLNYE